MPRHFGIIGYPLVHSFSPAYFKKKFATLGIDAVYEPYPIAAVDAFPALLANHPGIEGLNVTIPYKESIIPFLDEMDGTALEIGAVNCISITDGKTKGYNTDVTGFELSLIPLLAHQHTQALILGSGGSSRAVAYVLKQLGIAFQKVSRYIQDSCLTYDELTPAIIEQHKLIVNTTPTGQYPDTHHAPPIPYDGIGPHHLLYDLVYNPDETLFLLRGKERGAVIKNGFEMLQLQADASWQIWTNQPTV